MLICTLSVTEWDSSEQLAYVVLQTTTFSPATIFACLVGRALVKGFSCVKSARQEDAAFTSAQCLTHYMMHQIPYGFLLVLFYMKRDTNIFAAIFRARLISF
jgi:hypothetical protein